MTGADFIRQLKLIVTFHEFKMVENGIFSALGEDDADFQALLNAARKAVAHGYNVYVLPNPKYFRTADFIFERKGVFKMFDLKTITGKNSADNRLSESVGQSNRILLNMTIDYNPGTLARNIKHFFEYNYNAREVLVFKGQKQISVTRQSLEDGKFFQTFIRRYTK